MHKNKKSHFLIVKCSVKEAEQGNCVRGVWGGEVEVMGKVMLVEVCLAGCSPSACLKMFRVTYYRFCANRWIQLMHEIFHKEWFLSYSLKKEKETKREVKELG